MARELPHRRADVAGDVIVAGRDVGAASNVRLRPGPSH
jgi:hypothetical protein